MSFVLSPNMALPVPVVGNEPGPQYASDVNNSLTILDQHNHSLGSGVQITPSGLNINSSLSMGDNALTSTQAITYQAQSSDPSSFSSYMKGVDFYLKDGSGNVIRLTQSGSVAGATGTITGLPSGTASASFAAGVFVFQASTATAANIDGGSFVLRNNTPSSNGLTLAPPNAMGSNYSVTLPAPNTLGQTGVLTYDTSNNMGSITYDAVGQGMTSVGANAILGTSNSASLGGIPTAGGGFLAIDYFVASTIYSGFVDGSASGSGPGFNWTRPATGVYQITLGIFFSGISAVTATSINVTALCSVNAFSNAGFTINTSNSTTGSLVDVGFYFIAIGSR